MYSLNSFVHSFTHSFDLLIHSLTHLIFIEPEIWLAQKMITKKCKQGTQPPGAGSVETDTHPVIEWMNVDHEPSSLSWGKGAQIAAGPQRRSWTVKKDSVELPFREHVGPQHIGPWMWPWWRRSLFQRPWKATWGVWAPGQYHQIIVLGDSFAGGMGTDRIGPGRGRPALQLVNGIFVGT